MPHLWSGSEIDFVAPSVDDRVTIEVIDELDDALLQLVFRVDADVTEDRAGSFGEEPLYEVEPGAVLGSEHKGEALLGLSGEPSPGFLRDVRRVIVENDLDRGFGGISPVEDFEELDELPTAMAILDQRVHLTGEQVDAGHQSHCAMAFVFVIALDGGVGAGYWSKIGSRVADRLDPGFLVIGDDRDLVPCNSLNLI